jgi:hypothetical protein
MGMFPLWIPRLVKESLGFESNNDLPLTDQRDAADQYSHVFFLQNGEEISIDLLGDAVFQEDFPMRQCSFSHLLRIKEMFRLDRIMQFIWMLGKMFPLICQAQPIIPKWR